MIDLKLRENEGVILQENRVGSGKMMSGYNDQLILTNLNVIYITRNIFGKINEIKKLPLSKIKSINNEPQVMTTKNPSTNLYQLQIFFTTEQLTIEFSSGGKKEINKWHTAIKKQIKINTKQDMEELEIEKEDISIADVFETQFDEVGEKIKEAKQIFDNVQGKLKSKKVIILKICRIYFLLIFAFFGLVAFGEKQILSGLIALVQIGFLVFSILIEKGKVKGKFIKYRIPAIILSFALFIPSILAYNPLPSNAKKYDWSEIELCEIIPEPQSNLYNMLSNSSEELSLYVYEISRDDFVKYIEECKNIGFIIESKRDDNSYFAYNKTGYSLNLYHDEDKEKLDIDLNKPLALGDLIWPNNELVELIPKPNTEIGKIESSNNSEFKCYLGEISKTAFETYISECISNGFNVESVRYGDNHYTAKNEDSCILTLEYKGNCIVYLTLESAAIKENTEETETLTEEKSTTQEEFTEKSSTTMVENNTEETYIEESSTEEITEIEIEEEQEYIEMVWIPSSGSKYHSRSGCSGMKNPSEVTKENAIAWGYSPCGRCY